MASITLRVNGRARHLDVDPATPLLWILRDTLNLTGTKYGCGIAQCGAGTVHLDGAAIRSCVTRVGSVGNRAVTTIGPTCGTAQSQRGGRLEGEDPSRTHRDRYALLTDGGEIFMKMEQTPFATVSPCFATKSGSPGCFSINLNPSNARRLVASREGE